MKSSSFSINIKFVQKAAFLVAVSCFSLTCCVSDPSGSKVLATIGDKNITVKEFREQLDKVPAQYRQQYIQYAQTEEGKKKILTDLISRKIIMVEADRQGIAKSPEAVKKIEEYKDEARKQLEEQQKSIKTALQNLNQDATEQIVRGQLLKQEIEDKVTVTDAEARAYFNSHKSEFKKPDGSMGSFKESLSMAKQNALRAKEMDFYQAWLTNLQKVNNVQINDANLKDLKL